MNYIDTLLSRRPELASLQAEIALATNAVIASYQSGGKVLLVGNGGSAADAEHVAGEFLKGFISKRPPNEQEAARLCATLGDDALKLQRGVPAIPLPSIIGALSAYANDVDPSLVFAQLVFALGKKEDVLIAFSTSGNSKNIVNAVKCAAAQGIKTVALTGRGGGALATLADICIRVPADETYLIQEYHLPVYHAICAEVERILF